MRNFRGPDGNMESLGSVDRNKSAGQTQTSMCSQNVFNFGGRIPDLAKMSLETIAPGCTNPQIEFTSSIYLSELRAAPDPKLTGQSSPRESHGLVEYDPSSSNRSGQHMNTDELMWGQASCSSTETTTSPSHSEEDVEVMVDDDQFITHDTQDNMSGRRLSRPKYTWDEKIVILYLHVVLDHSWKVVAQQFSSYQDGKGQEGTALEDPAKRTISGLQSEAYRLFGCREWNLVKRRTSIPGGKREAINKNRFRERIKSMKKENFLKRLEEKFSPSRACL